MEKSEEGMYSKFKGLDYKKDDTFCDFVVKNRYFVEILENSALYASNFTEMNDIDEFRYSFCYDKNITKQNKKKLLEKIQNLYSAKEKFYFTSFSEFSEKAQDYLMWAHYANRSLGVRIDFKVSDQDEKNYVVPIKYSNNFPEISDIENIQAEKLLEIVSTKNSCWRYERERRAIFSENDFNELRDNGKHYFPIQIQSITLGRKFCMSENSRVYDPDLEKSRKFDKNVIEVAKFIYQILKNNKKYSLKMPEIRAYKTKYSPKTSKITEDLLVNFTFLIGIFKIERKG
ncbi:DUF2971 domain-containing protein [Campylobacter sp. JMF_08 NE1]|uniref:DUF2971 domain-containing protein n=1 Tax=Campylobacter sp. JMF_08 NE1 TaxID=2983821 RepID=UPI0022E9B0DE|nr:DUF2971 domain-containing protein [Campylobacter sp. JMF_08 NE1]MDA3048627.1 DUF2971 domain-containing protein [Campylobacter sp. JMF_08 NE1]